MHKEERFLRSKEKKAEKSGLNRIKKGRKVKSAKKGGSPLKRNCEFLFLFY